ncbi:hypothetical protein D3C81_665130 [compost metagenome]
MSIRIYSENLDEVKNGFWMLHSDVICDICGRVQPYAEHTCRRCLTEIKYNLLNLNDNFPIVFDSASELCMVEEKINAGITAAKLLSYSIEYFPVFKSMRLSIRRDNKTNITLTVVLNNEWKLKSIFVSNNNNYWRGQEKQNTFTDIIKYIDKWLSLI